MDLDSAYIIGIFSSGLIYTKTSNQIAGLIAIALTLTYAFNGATWMLIKSDEVLHKLAVSLARLTLRLTMITLFVLVVFILYEFGSIKLMTHLILFFLAAVIYCLLEVCLGRIAQRSGKAWLPFVGVALLLAIYVIAIACTCYPYIVPQRMTIWEGAASIESLRIIFIGAMVLLPMIIVYNILLHRVFWGKLSNLTYD